jgi:hypothetical protein
MDKHSCLFKKIVLCNFKNNQILLKILFAYFLRKPSYLLGEISLLSEFSDGRKMLQGKY